MSRRHLYPIEVFHKASPYANYTASSLLGWVSPYHRTATFPPAGTVFESPHETPAQSIVLGTQETCSEDAVNEGIHKFGEAVMLSQVRSAFSTSSLELSGWSSKCAAKRLAVTLNSPDSRCWWTWSCLLTQRNLMREAHERVNSRPAA